jgi:hypothetical protein
MYGGFSAGTNPVPHPYHPRRERTRMADQPQAPKIIVDTDWKSQAQAEKERLAAAEKAKAPPPGAGPAGAPAGAAHDHEGVPQPNFEELVRMLATQALLYLGAFPDPESGRRMVSLELAQFNIDLLTTLEAKTRGNLDEHEKEMLTHMLYELRMQYVEISKAVAKAVEQGRISPGGGMGGGGMGGMGGVTGPGVPNINIKAPPGT